jgi:hypothetical protein
MTAAVRVFVIVVVSLVTSLVAAPLHAQPAPHGGWFVDGFVAAVSDDYRHPDTPAPRAVLGYGMAFGLDGGSSGIEIDLQVPPWYTRTEVDRYQLGGPSSGFGQQGHFYESTYTQRHRSIDAAVMYRHSTAVARHFTFTWLLGGASVYRPYKSGGTTRDVDSGVTTSGTYNTSRDYLALAARADLEITIVRHVSMVPRLQFLAFPSWLDDSGLAPRGVVARPEMAIRWRF